MTIGGKEAASVPEPTRSVLVADDSAANLKILGTILRQAGYEIYVARDGAGALAIAREIQPGLILLDIMMPEMDGYEVCRRLKSLPGTAEIPVIFLTARVESEDLVEGFQAGAVDYVRKPFQQEELLARVRLHLELRYQRDEIRRIGNERKELIHVLCHDLKAPLAAMDSILSIMQDDREYFESRWDQFVEASTVTVRNGLNIVDMVRAVHSLEERLGTGNLELQTVNLRESIDTALVILSGRLKSKEIQMDVKTQEVSQANGASDATGARLWVLAEPVSLTNTVLLNLITNAIKFSPRGARISITARPSETQPDVSVELEISDRGIGIPPHILERLFEPGQNTTRPGTEKEAGTGFGMPLVKRFVTAYGGKIEVISSDENASADGVQTNASGTTVRIALRRASGGAE